MQPKETGLSLAIPTYRPKKVVETVQVYDRHFSEHNHHVPIVVFDDSPDNQAAKNLEAHLGQTSNPVYVVGTSEKARLLGMISERVSLSIEDREILKKLLRPSFGGNRNNILLYTAGERFMAVDDDIRPYGLVGPDFNRNATRERIVIWGYPVLLSDTYHRQLEQDVVAAFDEVLGRRVRDVRGFQKGNHVWDPKSDLYTNRSRNIAANQSVFHLCDVKDEFGDAVIKMAETGLTGTDDLDTLDFLYFFMKDIDMEVMTDPGKVYILSTYRPFITKDNWKTACGVSGYDNSAGLPSFFPTKLRFEDYAYRLWVQRDDLASAHVKAMQHHQRDGHERPSPPKDILNEEFANFLKDKLRRSLQRIDDTHMEFGYDGTVTDDDTMPILALGTKCYDDLREEAMRTKGGTRRREKLDGMADEMFSEFSYFDKSAFRQKMQKVVAEEMYWIKRSQELWPRIIEAAFGIKDKSMLPARMVSEGANAQRMKRVANYGR